MRLSRQGRKRRLLVSGAKRLGITQVSVRMNCLPRHYVNITWTEVPRELLEKYGAMTLAIDIMAINKIPFIISTSRNKHFGTAKLICNKTKRTLMMLIQQIARICQARGFQICNILGDGCFKYIRNGLSDMGITLCDASSNQHARG